MAAMRTASVVLLFGIGVAAITVGLTVHQDSSKVKSNREEIDEFIRDSSGTIEISGTVVDQDGNALEDVEIQVAEVSPHDLFGTLSKRKSSAFARRFQIKRSGVAAIDCIFLKEGHYSERRSFSMSGEASDSHENVLSEQDVVIVLQRIPRSAPLEKYEGFLRSDVSGRSSVLYTRKLPLSGTPLTAEQLKERRRLNLARPHVFLDPDVDSDGRISRVLIDIKDIGGMQTILSKGRIGLSQPDSGDGFVEVNISESSSLVGKRFRQMAAAPSTGYEPQLFISADSGEDFIFFYCRIHGQYGKGAVTNMAHILTTNGVESAGVKIIIYLNPTGSGDVSYFHP